MNFKKMFSAPKEQTKELYKNHFAKEDAERILAALGNEASIRHTIEENNITDGRWEFILKELYKMLHEKELPILKDIYFEVSAMGDISPLWTRFTHRETIRQNRKMDDFIDQLVLEAHNRNMKIEDIRDALSARIEKYNEQDKQIAENGVYDDEKPTKQEPETDVLNTEEAQPLVQQAKATPTVQEKPKPVIKKQPTQTEVTDPDFASFEEPGKFANEENFVMGEG